MKTFPAPSMARYFALDNPPRIAPGRAHSSAGRVEFEEASSHHPDISRGIDGKAIADRTIPSGAGERRMAIRHSGRVEFAETTEPRFTIQMFPWASMAEGRARQGRPR